MSKNEQCNILHTVRDIGCVLCKLRVLALFDVDRCISSTTEDDIEKNSSANLMTTNL